MLRHDQKIVCEAYLEFIRNQRCLVCSREGADPDHLIARGTEESKRNDFTAVPLCREHHSERGHGTAAFENRYSVNLWECAAFLLMEFWPLAGIEAPYNPKGIIITVR